MALVWFWPSRFLLHLIKISVKEEEKKNKRGTGDQAAAAYPSLAALTLVAGANLFGQKWWWPI
jgi:hypothetical protein